MQRKAQQLKVKPETNVTVLAKKELDQIITTKGVVQSTLKHTVYTQLVAKVKEIAVEVGDTVAAGDLLAKLDTRDVEKSIGELQNSIKTANNQQNTLISQAKKKITDAKDQKAIDASDRQKAVTDAATAKEDAYMDVRIAAEDVADAAAESAILADSRVVNAKSVLATAQTAMNVKKAAIVNLQAQIAAADAASLPALEASLATANSELVLLTNTFNDAQSAYDSTYDDVKDDIYDDKWQEAYKDAFDARSETIDAADSAYEQAVQNLNNSLRSDDLAIQDRNNALTNQKLSDTTTSLKNQLATAQMDLEDSTITSPVAGTVTEVIATLGSRPTGALFVIEDTKSLEITTPVAEYDIPQIHEGQKVRFTTEATGNDELSGTVTLISPTAIDTDGNYEVTVRIDVPDERLRIGMNAKLTIILESRPAVYSVPYDAITTNAAGEKVVIGLRKDGITRYEIPVKVGMETDYFVEISGPEIVDGLTIHNDPEGKNVVTNSGPTSPFGG